MLDSKGINESLCPSISHDALDHQCANDDDDDDGDDSYGNGWR